MLDEELAKLDDTAQSGRYRDAAKLFGQLIKSDNFPEFLTLPAYTQSQRVEDSAARPSEPTTTFAIGDLPQVAG
jgi:hypothetical protein